MVFADPRLKEGSKNLLLAHLSTSVLTPNLVWSRNLSDSHENNPIICHFQILAW